MTVVCSKCSKPLGRADRFCGACGEATASLAWRGADRDDWSQASGKIALTGARGAVQIVLRNEGVVPLGVGIGAESLLAPPPWLDATRLRAMPPTRFIEPGLEADFEIPLDRRAIDVALQPTGVREVPHLQLSHPIRLVTTAPLPGGVHVVPPVVEVLIAIAREPRLSPPGMHFPYLAAEHLGPEGLPCDLDLVNDTADVITLTELRLADADAISGVTSVEAGALIPELPAVKGTSIAPGQRLKLALVLRDPGGHQPGEARWFNIEVNASVHSPTSDDDLPVQALIQGYIGLGPRLERRSPRTLVCERQFGEWTGQIELYNPAPIPVRIGALSIRDEHDLARPDPDWLIVEEQGGLPGQVVEGHSTRVLRLRIDPSRRPRDEWTKEICTRIVRISHDGHPPGNQVEVTIQARLGEVILPRNVVLGVDFGTSNSTVWLVSDLNVDEGLAVEPANANVPKRDRMASAMFYRGAKGGHAFDYGAVALRQCGREPRNLVRGVKTLVNQPKRLEHNFVSGSTYVRMQATDLLSEFIGELHRRANRTINELVPGRRIDFGFPSNGELMVPAAVFTHPVGPSPAMIEALHRAAVRQGLVDEDLTLEQFRSFHCIDEATAAIVAYVWLRALRRLPQNCEIQRECVLCVDIGGGTMDVAAAEVLGFDQYWAGSQVTIRLCANEGDPRFGGDHIDKLIAREALRGLGERAVAARIELPMQVLVAAIESPESFTGFRDWYDHCEHVWPNLTADNLQNIFSGMARLRDDVEMQKKAFDGTQDFHFLMNPGDLFGVGDPAALIEQIDVALPGPQVADLMRMELESRLNVIDKVCLAAGWTMTDISTVLLTGQSNYYEGYCKAVEAHVRDARGSDAPPLRILTPRSQDALCPKGCVALGAAIWGVNQNTVEGWLAVDCDVARRLTFNVQWGRGPGRFQTIEGLGRGAPFPAVGTVPLPAGKVLTYLPLFRDERPWVDIILTAAASRLRVEVRGPRDVWFYADDDPNPRPALFKDSR